jgi:hypothetical protein
VMILLIEGMMTTHRGKLKGKLNEHSRSRNFMGMTTLGLSLRSLYLLGTCTRSV